MGEQNSFLTEQDINIMKNKAERLFEYEKDTSLPSEKEREQEDPHDDSVYSTESFQEYLDRKGIMGHWKSKDDLETFIRYWEDLDYRGVDEHTELEPGETTLNDIYYQLTGVHLGWRQIGRVMASVHAKYRKLKYATRGERNRRREEYIKVSKRGSSGGGRVASNQYQTNPINPGTGRNVRGDASQTDAFPGEIYRDYTKIDKSILNKWKKQSISNWISGTEEYIRHFIIGYELKFGGLFYEIWYNTKTATFEVIDHNGFPIEENINTLEDAVRQFLNMISDHEDKDFKKGVGSSIARNAQDNLRRTFLRNESVNDYFSIDEEWIQSLVEKVDLEESPYFDEDDQERQSLLEQTNNIRQSIKYAIEQEKFDEYYTSKLGKREVKSLLVGVVSGYLSEKEKRTLNLEQKIKVVAKRGFRNFFGLILKDIRVNFIVGFEIKGAVSTEIWEVVRKSGNRKAEFYVVDVTSRKVLRRNFTNFRQAVNEIRKRYTISNR